MIYLHLHYTLAETSKGRCTDRLPDLQNKHNCYSKLAQSCFFTWSSPPSKLRGGVQITLTCRQKITCGNSVKIAQFHRKTADLATLCTDPEERSHDSTLMTTIAFSVMNHSLWQGNIWSVHLYGRRKCMYAIHVYFYIWMRPETDLRISKSMHFFSCSHVCGSYPICLSLMFKCGLQISCSESRSCYHAESTGLLVLLGLLVIHKIY